MTKCIAALALIAASLPLVARENPEQGQWMVSVLATRTEAPASVGVGPATSPSVAFGYGITDSLTAEVSYMHWVADRGEANSRWISGIWSLPRGTSRLQPYVVAGGGMADFEPDGGRDESHAQVFGGVGAFGDLGSRVSWRADVRAVKTADCKALDPYAQAGLTFFFGNVTAPVRDSDGDGVADSQDACPGTPLGVAVDARGCPLPPPDDDGDGVPNDDDECPGTPAGTRVDSKGCPLDEDGDGVLNVIDECPGTPSGTRVDESGCALDDLDGAWIDSTGQPLSRGADGAWIDSAGRPVTRNADGLWVDADGRPVTRESGGLWVDSAGRPVPVVVLFEFDEAEVGSSYVQILWNHAAYLRTNDAWTVRVEGHADTSGTDDYNQELGERRANAVRDVLVSAGVGSDRVSVVSFGEGRQLVNADASANRRAVVIYVE